MKRYEEDDDDDDLLDDDDGEAPSRSRLLLANFYGSLGKEENKESSQEERNQQRALDPIDRNDFDADSHVRDLLETKSLSELLSEDDRLCSDVKTLSSEMQMLVYENYSKFISATDTIRDMQENVQAMEGEMLSLTTTMADIDIMSASVNSSLADKRSQIDKLVRARRLLKRLEFLFELPRKLSAAVAAKRYDEAVRYFSTTDEILAKYSHVPSLAEIRSDASRIAFGLRDTLRESFDTDPSEPPEDLAERVDLLVRLGADRKECRSAAFRSGFAHLTWLLRTAIAKSAGSLPLRVASIVADVTPRFVQVADSLNAISSGPSDEEEDDEPSLDSLALSLFSEYIDAVETLVTKEIYESTTTEIFAKETAQALEVAGDCVETAAHKCGVGAALKEKLASLARRVATGRLEASISQAKKSALEKLAGLAALVVSPSENGDKEEGVDLAKLREACVSAAQSTAAESAKALDRVSPLWSHLEEDELLESSSDLVAWIAATAEAFGEVRSVLDVDEDALDDRGEDDDLATTENNGTATSAVVRDAPESFADICERWKVVNTSDKSASRNSSNPRKPLAAAVVATELKIAMSWSSPSSSSLPAVDVEEFDQSNDDNVTRLGERSSSTTSSTQLNVTNNSLATARRRLTQVVEDRRLDRAASALLSRFVRLSAAEVRRNHADLFSFDVEAAKQEPRPVAIEAVRAVDAAADAVAQAVLGHEAAEDDDDDVLLSSNDNWAATAAATPRTPSAPRVGGIELDVERLFARRESSRDLTSSISHWTPDEVAASLLKTLARTLVETVRRAVLDKGHYDQIELDARYLHSAVERRVSDADNLRDLERLISEFIQSASERCLSF